MSDKLYHFLCLSATPWPDLEQNSSDNELIKQIIDEVKLGDQWRFGVALGLPLEDLKSIITGRHTSNHPSITMYEIFSCWDRKVVDPTQRSWKQVIHALNTIGYKAL